MGRGMESVYEVTEFESNKKYGFKSKSSLIESYTLYTLERVKYGTRISALVQIEPGDTGTSSELAMEKTIKKQYRENLALLKEILETGPAGKLIDDVSIVPGRSA